MLNGEVIKMVDKIWNYFMIGSSYVWCLVIYLMYGAKDPILFWIIVFGGLFILFIILIESIKWLKE